MDMEENVNTEELEVNLNAYEKKRWPAVVVTAVVTIFVTMAITTVLFFARYSEELNFAGRYYKLYELDRIIDENFIGEADIADMLDLAAVGLVEGTGDYWSSYMTAEELAEYSTNLSNSYVGIGVTVTKEEGEYIYISSVDPSGGAFEAGIMPGDYIKAVDGKDVKDMVLSDVTAIIKGKEGSTVELTILRGEEEIIVTAQRRSIKEVSIKTEMFDSVGYVKIINFYENTGEDFIAAVDELIEQGATGLVFDVRFNGGGYLKELKEMLDYVLPEGVIFKTEDIYGNVSTTDSDADCIELPIAVLINDMSISAAEYFAAVIDEYDRCVLVGTPTVGKGYSQRLFYLSDGSAVNLSTSKYYTPGGVCLAGVGIKPDIEIETEYEEYSGIYYGTLSYDEDSQLKAAIEAVKEL